MHFGLYSIRGWHEQEQWRGRVPRKEYVKLIDRFNPVHFDPDRILDLAESVGMEYVCLTAKHHDGFCLWDTQETPYNVMNSPYGRDVIKELADACHRRNFSLGLYYSVADWHHRNYPNEGRTHELPPQPGDDPDMGKYVAFLTRQLRELCTRYGEIRHFFWDMNVPKHQDPSVNEMLHQLQPTMVINHRGFDEGDFDTVEREYIKNQTDRLTRFERPSEACNSVDTESWGYRKDESYYSNAFLIQSIDAAMAKGANYMLNVGPNGDGVIPESAAGVLRDIGRWYGKTREAFEDSEPATDFTINRNVLLTRRENVLYVHVPVPVRSETIRLPPIDREPTSAVLLNTGASLRARTELLPAFWKSGRRVLVIRDLPIDGSVSETLVVRLQFDEPVVKGRTEDFEAFEG